MPCSCPHAPRGSNTLPRPAASKLRRSMPPSPLFGECWRGAGIKTRLNLLVVLADLWMMREARIDVLEHRPHIGLGGRTFHHHHQGRLIGGGPHQAPAAVFQGDAHAVDCDNAGDLL